MRRRVAVAIALPVAAAGAVAAVVAVGSGGAEPGRAASGGGRHGSAVVERRTLVERQQVDGTLGYGDPRPALDRVGGTLTWLPEAGAVIRPGERLFAVDDLPVVLMDGTVPAWRTLEAGMSDGSDVLQLERNLAALGHDPGTVDDEFTSATAAAVERWQEASGLPETGRVELGRVVFLPGPRRVAAVTGTLGSSGGGGGGGGGASDVTWEDGGGGGGARTAAWDGGARFVPIADSGGATPTGDTTPTAPATTTPTTPSTTLTTPSTTPTTPDDGGRPRGGKGDGRSGPPDDGGGDGGGSRGRDGESPSAGSPGAGGAPQRGGSPGGSGGGDGGSGGGGAGTEVLETTSTERVVTAELDAADQALARVGRAATVTLPSGRTVRGRIVAVGTVATDSGDDQGGGAGGGSGDGSATLPVTIRLRSARGAGGLDEAPVSVALARTTRRNVLAVPVQALVARAGGGYAVRVARASAAGGIAEVPVEPGLYADGWVELLDGDVRPGDRVEVPR